MFAKIILQKHFYARPVAGFRAENSVYKNWKEVKVLHVL